MVPTARSCCMRVRGSILCHRMGATTSTYRSGSYANTVDEGVRLFADPMLNARVCVIIITTTEIRNSSYKARSTFIFDIPLYLYYSRLSSVPPLSRLSCTIVHPYRTLDRAKNDHVGPYSVMLLTTPEPIVRPPSRMAKRRPGSMGTGWISSTWSVASSPGMTMAPSSARITSPVTSAVRK